MMKRKYIVRWFTGKEISERMTLKKGELDCLMSRGKGTMKERPNIQKDKE